ncbi:hypothetical protein ACA910_006242 [Epithemia clementina (nom. ined.)]
MGVESPHCTHWTNELPPPHGLSEPGNDTPTKPGNAQGQKQGKQIPKTSSGNESVFDVEVEKDHVTRSNTSDEIIQFQSLSDFPVFLKGHIKEDQDHLSSFTYSNCPFAMAKFSQYHMAKTGPFESAMDEMINSLMRAEMALKLSNDARVYQRVRMALEKKRV